MDQHPYGTDSSVQELLQDFCVLISPELMASNQGP